MAVKKEEIYRLIDKLPEHKQQELLDVLYDMIIPVEVPTEEEREAIEKGIKEIEDGEYVTFDELYKKIMSDDE